MNARDESEYFEEYNIPHDNITKLVFVCVCVRKVVMVDATGSDHL